MKQYNILIISYRDRSTTGRNDRDNRESSNMNNSNSNRNDGWIAPQQQAHWQSADSIANQRNVINNFKM